MSNQDFINRVLPGAKKTFQKYGIFPSITIAQAINESGWGGSSLAKTDKNLFGIKYPGNHDPSLKISKGTWATDDGGYYTHYESWDDSIIDHGYFLKNNPRYTQAGVFNAKNPQDQMKAIQAAGYASASDYVDYTLEIIKDNNLTQYDDGSYTGYSSANNEQGLAVEATNYQVIKGSLKEGDILFGRRYRIIVSDKNGNALDISQLHCVFYISKTIQMEPNTSELIIYNLNAQTENFILINATRITIEAGYEGAQFGLIFDGDILQTIREKENANTFKLTIIALDSDRAINFDVVNFSIARGQTPRDIVNHMATAANPISLGSISEKLSEKRLTRGKVLFGKASDYYRQIAKSNELHYFMDDGSLNLISLSDLPSDEIIELSPQSGLVGIPEQTDYGVSGQCLLNPQIKLNSLLHIDNSLVRLKRIDANGTTGAVIGGNSNSNSDVRNRIIAEAKQICDDPNIQYSQEYRGQTVNGITYWDCSSFVKHCYESAGFQIADITYNQYALVENDGKFISESEALPGDLVFWGEGAACHHIAIYAGDGYVYAARGRDGKAPQDQVAYHALYGSPKFGRPKCLLDNDKGLPPSAVNNENSEDNVQSLIRSLDKDGIYRVIKLEYIGDTRGADWYVSFETISQIGGNIPTVST